MTDNHQFDENLKRMLQSALERPRAEFQEKLRREVLAEVARERARCLEQRSAMEAGGRMENTAGGLAEGLESQGGQTESACSRGRSPLPLTGEAGSRGRSPLPAVRLWELMRDSLRRQLKWGVLGGAVALIAILLVMNLGSEGSNQLMGRVNCLYGLVALQGGGATQAVSGSMDLKAGQRITTESGSRAELVLRDQSKITPDPRTSFLVAQGKQGPRIQLEQGRINLEATKQAPGKFITVEASGAQVKVLGTRLDVRVVQKPSAERQTVVRVHSGSVELASAGKSVLLLPGMVGVADENQPPVGSSLTFEVNELIQLLEQTNERAAQSGRNYETPVIIDFTTETIWTVVPSRALQASGPDRLGLRLKYPAFGARAYMLDGAEIASEGTGTMLLLERGSVQGTQWPEHFILKVPGMRGMLTESGKGMSECTLPGGSEEMPRLVQLHLPEAAHVAGLSPAPQSSVLERNRLIVTVLAAVRLPQVHD